MNVEYETGTKLPEMRLTLAMSLILSNKAGFGVRTTQSTRHPLFPYPEDESAPLVMDYYDEYAVDMYGRGFHHDLFDSSEPVMYDAKYYLGEPLEENPFPDEFNSKPSPKWYRDDFDLLYREFDHGLVIAHLGICDKSTEWDLPFDALDLLEDPRDDPACTGGCCFMEIYGSSVQGYYNDGRNMGRHWGDVGVQLAPGADGLILLKEGDGFYIDLPGHGE